MSSHHRWATVQHPSHPQGAGRRGVARALTALALAALALPASPIAAQVADAGASDGSALLRLEKYAAPERAFHVVSTLIVGPTESILFDAQYKVSDGRRLAERIEATGTTLQAVVLSHADHDHYMGALEVLEAFPGTPVYTPGPLQVDGQDVVVIDGLVGDVRAPASAALWIPSLRTLLAGDLVFEGIHPWLGNSDAASRTEWRRSLRRLGELEPVAVVPGHKRDVTTPDAPSLIDFMLRYLDDYDAAMDAADAPEDVVSAMVADHPDLALPILMEYGARTWFKR